LRAAGRRFVIVVTKADLATARRATDVGDAIGDGRADSEKPPVLPVSAATGAGIAELIEALAAVGQQVRVNSDAPIIGDLLQPGDVCVLVTPIDGEAPAGRMILPQVQVLRDILDAHAIAVFSQPEQLAQTMAGLAAPPRLVITDSQVFGTVAAQLPPDQPLTSFSMLFARHKGDLDALTTGAAVIDRLRPGDPVLIAEACTHHPVADDIGRVKIPNWLRRKVGGELDFAWTAGYSFPPDLARFKLIVHCGGCMISRREMLTRIAEAQAGGVPIVNYGVLIAHLHGIMPRALQPLTEVSLTRTP
jgi:[FeFe] hydrogenase H-cluster maturation GTPase HydF